MKIFPAIDLYDKKAVRLYKGDYSNMTVYSDKPWEIAKDFKECGAEYIHVVDLAKAHLCAIDYTERMKGIDYINVGTGNGYSVLEMVKAFGEVWGSPIKYKIAPRRPGDIAECYADPKKAYEVLGWKAENDLFKMCEDSARWQRMNPDGYGE